VPGEPGSRRHTTYEKACAVPFSLEREGTYIKHCLNCECATAARSMCLHKK